MSSYLFNMAYKIHAHHYYYYLVFWLTKHLSVRHLVQTKQCPFSQSAKLNELVYQFKLGQGEPAYQTLTSISSKVIIWTYRHIHTSDQLLYLDHSLFRIKFNFQ